MDAKSMDMANELVYILKERLDKLNPSEITDELLQKIAMEVTNEFMAQKSTTDLDKFRVDMSANSTLNAIDTNNNETNIQDDPFGNIDSFDKN